MAKRILIATIEIEAESHHQPWVFEHSIECAVRAISGGKVTASVRVEPQTKPSRFRRFFQSWSITSGDKPW